MLITERHYPHPVLSFFPDNDYPDKIFQPAFRPEPNKNYFRLVFKCRTSSQSLNDLIEKKQAAYCAHIECASTRYRDCFTSFEGEYEIDIPVSSLEGKVEVSRFIVCLEEVKSYSSEEFHTDFAGRSFDLMPGDILAVAPTTEFPADKRGDELATVPSIISVVASNEEEAPPMDVDLTHERIRVIMSKPLFNKFNTLKSSHDTRYMLTSMVYIPAILCTVRVLRGSDQKSAFMDKRWFRVFQKRFEGLGIDIMNLDDCSDSDLVLAGHLVGDPIDNAFDDLNEILVGYDGGNVND